MILGIGVDIEEINRFRKIEKNKRFLKAVFTEREIKYCQQKKEPFRSYAGKFCAKEAIIKAHYKPLHFKNIEIFNMKSSKLKVYINNKANPKIKCSISHCANHALAFSIIEK
ncbi:holo-ACP synthase [Candidatus Woesearchaeota archaeon]|nr:holo-ACP synthase [Candidatus Woesearchaeota archaeon]